MKKAFLAVITLLLLVGFGYGRPKQDFAKFLKANRTNFENYSSDKYYEALEVTNKKTGEKKKFADFPEIDRMILKLVRCDTLSHELEDLYNKWKDELKNAEETPEDEKEASKKNVSEYLEKLMTLRKENAEKVEALAGELFKKFPDKFTKEEQEYITKTIRTYHDKNNLVKR